MLYEALLVDGLFRPFHIRNFILGANRGSCISYVASLSHETTRAWVFNIGFDTPHNLLNQLRVTSQTPDISLELLYTLRIVFWMAVWLIGPLYRVHTYVFFTPFAVAAWLALIAAYSTLRAWCTIDGFLARGHIGTGVQPPFVIKARVAPFQD